MGAAERRKGAVAERELAGLLDDMFGGRIRRRLGQEREGGCDVLLYRFAIQVKNQLRLMVPKWLRQAEEDAGPDEVPVLMFRLRGGRWYVTMALEDWGELVREGLPDKGSKSRKSVVIEPHGYSMGLGRR